MEISQLIPFLIPVILIQLGLMIYGLVDLAKREKVKFDNKVIWGVIIVVFNIVGPIIYLLIGREE